LPFSGYEERYSTAIRFLTYEEEAQIRKIIIKRCPKHEPDFTVAIETGMRLSEQHTIEWSQVHLRGG
jgi:hypothetical protein